MYKERWLQRSTPQKTSLFEGGGSPQGLTEGVSFPIKAPTGNADPSVSPKNSITPSLIL